VLLALHDFCSYLIMKKCFVSSAHAANAVTWAYHLSCSYNWNL